MKDNLNRILWGIVLVLLGIIWGINALDIAQINIFFDGWWTLFIIVPCVIDLFDTGKDNKIGDLIGVVIGVILLLACRDVLSFDVVWKLVFPVIIVILGLSMIFGSAVKSKVRKKIEEKADGTLESITATFGEQNVNKSGESFSGANLDSVFGSIILDLTKAKLKEETVIKASAVFGGITIFVPNNCVVKVKSTPIFGGVTNRCKNEDEKKIIYVDAFCMFGGIDIK